MRRVVEVGSALAAVVALAVVLYNATLVDRRPPTLDRVALSLPVGDPHVGQTLTAIDLENWYRHVSLIGRVVSIELDAGLVDIDRLAVRYTGRPFGHRENTRFSAWLEPERWHAWSGGGPWVPG